MEQPRLCMAVANTDMGVGIIFPDGNGVPPTAPRAKDLPLEWRNFEIHRANWLNLISATKLAEYFFGENPVVAESSGVGAAITVVTLWREGWSATQEAVLDWVMGEDFPPGTQFVWTVVAGSCTEENLSRALEHMEGRGLGYSIELIEVPPARASSELQRHQIVAELYEEAARSVLHDKVLFLEDDVIPSPSAYRSLATRFDSLPEDAALLGACYESRARPRHWCASDTQGNYLTMDGTSGGLQEVGWVGGGFTLYRTDEVLRARPFFASGKPGWVKGWDLNLCERLRRQGNRLFVHTGLQAEHRFADAMRPAPVCVSDSKDVA
jgi:hypothetical protein